MWVPWCRLLCWKAIPVLLHCVVPSPLMQTNTPAIINVLKNLLWIKNELHQCKFMVIFFLICYSDFALLLGWKKKGIGECVSCLLSWQWCLLALYWHSPVSSKLCWPDSTGSCEKWNFFSNSSQYTSFDVTTQYNKIYKSGLRLQEFYLTFKWVKSSINWD